MVPQFTGIVYFKRVNREACELDLNTLVIKNKSKIKQKPGCAQGGSASGVVWPQTIQILWEVCELLAVQSCLQRTALKMRIWYLGKVR